MEETIHAIYGTDIEEYRTGPNKFGICMATYQRKNGKSPEYLTTSLQALMNQTAINWHLYLVGDKYENHEELVQTISFFPADKITMVNLPTAPERDNISNKVDLWQVGGCNAFNYSHQLAVQDGCDYILHHDDDDSFHIKKIQILNYVLSEYPDPLYLFHYSFYISNIILPRESFEYVFPNNLQIQKSNAIHTSIAIHHTVASSFKYEGYLPEKTTYTCGDIQLIEHLEQQLKYSAKYCIFIPVVLCSHLVEGEIMN
jgi:hypothetical protein